MLARSAQMFPELTDAQIARVAAIGKRREIAAGEVLFDVGEQNTRFFVVLEGTIEVVRPVGDARSRSSCTGPGSSPARSTCSPRGAAWCAGAVKDAGEVIAVDRDDLRAAGAARLRAERDPDARLHPAPRGAPGAKAAATWCCVGSRHSASTLRIREFLSRNGQPFTYQDVETDPGVQALLDRFHVGVDEVPVDRLPGRPRAQEPVASRSWPRSSACSRHARPDGGARRRHRRRRAGRAGGGGLRRVRGARRPGAREHGARRAGRHELAHRELPRLPHRASPGRRWRAARCTQAEKFGAEVAIGAQRRAPRLRQPAVPDPSRRRRGACARARSWSPPACSTAGWTCRCCARFEGAGVYYSATHLEAQLCAGRGGGRRRRRELGRPGRRVPRRSSPRTFTCSCAGRAWPRACPAI